MLNKYRVWNKIGSWAKGIYMTQCGQIYDSVQYNNPMVDNDEYVIQLFTGLLDKNGKEIYEGDIIKQIWQGFKEELIYITCGEIIDDWTIHIVGKNKLNRVGNLYQAIDIDNAEIIGNIFENCELLN